LKIWLFRRRYTAAGGAERFTQRLASRLHRDGFDVWIAAEEWPESHSYEYRVQPISSHDADSYARAVLSDIPKRREGIIFSLERTLRQNVFRAGDGVHASWLERRKPFQSFFQKMGTSLSIKHRDLLELEKKVFDPRFTNCVVANSELVKGEILDRFTYPADRIKVVYSGVDLNKFQPCTSEEKSERRKAFGIPEDAIVWSFVGSGFERKGLRWAIEITALQKEKLWLLVLGKGKTGSYLHLAEKLGFASRLKILTPMTSALHVYQASDAFILPTIYDPCSNACLEAAACGIPVITTKANGASELTSGRVLENPSSSKINAEQCAEFTRPLSTPSLTHESRQKLDENQYWDQLIKTINEEAKRSL
jgi:UDP-glucose:(heptosyl)LPS alpha-1,3-glucosyltransferase